MSEFYVYAHKRLDTNAIFYVGKGARNRAYSKSGRNRYWKNIVNKAGYSVVIVNSGVDEQTAFALEIELIGFLREEGVVLCNMTDGGEGSSGFLHTEESKSKISGKVKGVPKPDSQKAKLRELLLSGEHPIFSEAAKEKTRGENHWAYGLVGEDNPNYGRKDTPEIIEAKRTRMLGRKMGECSQERKDKIRAAKIGKKVSDTSKFHWERERIVCPHCGKEGIVSNMKRWHFDNCKEKSNVSS
jgi:hypothetical protein